VSVRRVYDMDFRMMAPFLSAKVVPQTQINNFLGGACMVRHNPIDDAKPHGYTIDIWDPENPTQLPPDESR